MRKNQPQRVKARRERALERRQRDSELWGNGSHPTSLCTSWKGPQSPESKRELALAEVARLTERLP